MIPRFRFPYTMEQVGNMLHASVMAEVSARYRTFKQPPEYLDNLRNVAEWLTSTSPKFGLFICGNRGNGKTTLLQAIRSLYLYLNSDEPRREIDFPEFGFDIVTAKELVRLAKAYNNPNKENQRDVHRYKRLMRIEALGIDDLGAEPRESMHYGDYVTAVIDIISYRYQEQLCTMATSNLAPSELKTYYDERFADRLREMMHIVNFGNQPSFRAD